VQLERTDLQVNPDSEENQVNPVVQEKPEVLVQ